MQECGSKQCWFGRRLTSSRCAFPVTMVNEESRAGYRGFTLIELLVVLAMVALLAALTLPSYAALQRRALAREGAFHLTALAGLQEQLRLARGRYQSAESLLAAHPLPASLGRYYRLNVMLEHPSGFLISLLPLPRYIQYPTLSIDGLGRRLPRDLWH